MGCRDTILPLPDCLKFFWNVWGRRKAWNFWDIAALTGDTVAQVYDRFPPTAANTVCPAIWRDARIWHMCSMFWATASEYAESRDIAADPARYREKVAAFIDRGSPSWRLPI